MKKLIFALVCAMLLAGTAYAREPIPMDVVLVIDVSRSMITADPQRMANQAMNMFINELTLGRDRVGVVAYAGHVTYSRPLHILCEDERTYLQDRIYHLAYASWTDHPLGLLKALEILGEPPPGRQGIIVFLTDGNLNVNPQSARTMGDALEDNARVIATAQERNIPIYTIGLNFDGALDQSYVMEVAYQTSARGFITTASEDLPDILGAIFSQMVMEPEPETEPPTVAEIVTKAVTETVTEAVTEAEILEVPVPRRWWLLAFLLLLMPLGFLKRKRVFTGQLTVTLFENGVEKSKECHSLVAYGNRLVLFDLLTLTPCKAAKSHLPAIYVKSKKPGQFTKDFIVYEDVRTMVIAPGSELVVTVDDVEIWLGYSH